MSDTFDAVSFLIHAGVDSLPVGIKSSNDDIINQSEEQEAEDAAEDNEPEKENVIPPLNADDSEEIDNQDTESTSETSRLPKPP